MANKKASKSRARSGTSFMFLTLHQDIMNAVSDEIPSAWFNDNDTDKGSNNNYETHVMGYFFCNNKACSNTGWGSKMVTILIRGYPGNGYNAVVFNQRCKSCNRLGSFKLDKDSYIERVAYRVKRWAGISTEAPYYMPREGPPHRESLCEGCKRGICRRQNK
ncbi:zinc-binding domain-domain-containing protein [Clohesyomyces aquaticus]|uniref:Zinc-binding domain-domain-containing protein n=1 Tax=Clohesyomyces aquaticus TaxID=1231657 RepID=A0A1Y2A0B8_9PLEO|nr:zinc-binding domain-domain-containing protein [Clohesyomyces aquaticus]